MEKRTIIALALSFIVVFSYPVLLKKFFPQYAPQPVTATAERDVFATSPSSTNASQPRAAAEWPSSQPAVSAPGAADPVPAEVVRMEPYILEIDPISAAIRSVSFTTFFNYETNEPLQFLKPSSAAWEPGAVAFLVDGKEETVRFNTKIDNRILNATALGNGFTVEKTIEFDKSSYINKLGIRYKNTTDRDQNIQVRVVVGSGLVLRNSIDTQYFETNWISEKAVEHTKASKDKTKISEQPFVATSVKSRHFSSLLMPSAGHQFLSETRGFDKHDFGAALVSPSIRVAPGEVWSEDFDWFIGPNSLSALSPLGLDHVVNFGKLDGICKILLGGMQLVYGVVRNYGVAIFLLTLGLNVLLFPLTRASFQSMSRMQLVQPQMARIKEKYGKDPTRMNKEMMELYKKHKVNPMGGCLPMVLQMPVFIALYVALCKTTDLLNARFLWIDDLASPDTVHLPFSLPFLGDTLHVLPIVMVVAMFFQQKITQKNMPVTDPNVARQQKMMAYIMPPFFGFIFYPMPSGLVIYWLTNTIVMTIIQYLMRRNSPASLPEEA